MLERERMVLVEDREVWPPSHHLRLLACENLVPQVAYRIVGNSGIMFGAEDQTDRRIFIRICTILSGSRPNN